MKRNITQEMQLDSASQKKIPDRKFNLDTRIQLLIGCVTMHKPDWKKLEVETGIPAEKWRQYTRGSTKASLEMAEALALKWPQYGFWLITGVSDERHGHHAPVSDLRYPGFDNVDEFVDDLTRQIPRFPRTTEYFQLAAKLAPLSWNMSEDNALNAKGSKKSEQQKELLHRSNIALLSALRELKDEELESIEYIPSGMREA